MTISEEERAEFRRKQLEAIMKADAVPMAAMRGEAIDAYSALEYAMAHLLSTLGDMPRGVAAIILFKLNARPRQQILDRLKTRKLKQEYSIFWKSAIARMRELDDARNRIVH